MLDLQFIRDNADLVRAAMKNKNRDDVDLDRLLELAERRKVAAGEVSEINRKRNAAQQLRDFEAGKNLKIEHEVAEEKYRTIEKELVSLLVKLPNIPSPDTPVGPDESGNKVIHSWGEKTKFSFEPKAHWDLGRDLGIINSEKAADVSSARFTYIMGDLVLVQFALIDLVFKTLTSRETLRKIIDTAGLPVSDKPFIPAVVPVMVKKQVQVRMARFMADEDHYLFPNDNLMLVGSAEHTLGPLHMDEVIREDGLPIRYVGYSTAFRREAGAAGKDTRGILRQHQFDKAEMETFCRPEEGYREQDFLVAIQEYLLQQLKLPYQVVLVCTGDMGFPDQRQIDIETWMPGQNTYRETNSADYVGGFQARRLQTRIKRNDGMIEPVHMNDATAFAIGRTLIAIMENYQQADGSIMVPEILRAYVGKDKITRSE